VVAAGEQVYTAGVALEPGDLASTNSTRVVATALERFGVEFADTADLRLLRWGVTLAHEGGGAWCMRQAGFVHTVAGIATAVPPRACDLAFGVARGEPVAVRARVRVTRRGVDVVAESGTALAAVRVDEVEVVTADSPDRGEGLDRDGAATGAGATFAIVRLVWGPAAGRKLVDRLRRRIERRGCKPVADTWVAARAMRAEDTEPEVAPSQAGPGSTVGTVVTAALGRAAVRLVHNDPLARVGEDPEGVHQMRVATRRMRSDLNTFRSVLDTAVTEPIRAELAWLAAILGGVRDADVLGRRLTRSVTRLTGTDRLAGERLLARLVEDRAAARMRLMDAMASGRYAALLDSVVDIARDPPLRGRAGKQASKVAAALVPDRALRRSIKRLGPEPGGRALHKIRIRAKRCRYAAEALVPVFGREAGTYAAVMSRCQDVLGAHTDAVVAQDWLRRAAAHGSRQEAFVAGFLAAEERARSEVQARSWPAVRDELLAKDLRRWLR